MRAITFSLILALSVAGADMPLESQGLDAEEKARLSRHAIETCDRTPVEVSGSSSESPDGDAWEAFALVYMAPRKSEAGLCKSRVCEYTARKSKAMGERTPRKFRWGKPNAIDGYSVWLTQNGECLGNPSSKIALIHPIEENTLRSLIEKSHALAEEGRAWLRSTHPDAALLLDDAVGELESISVEDDFGVLRYWLVYGGPKGLQLRLSTRDGKFFVHEAGPAPRP